MKSPDDLPIVPLWGDRCHTAPAGGHPRTASSRALAATSTALLAAALIAAPPALAASDAEAQAAAQTVTQAAQVPHGWTGSTPGCQVGTESAASLDATLRAVNAFRAVAGLQPVTFDATLNAKALAAATLMRAGNENGATLGLSHTPPNTWPCFAQLPDGVAAAGAATSTRRLGGERDRAVRRR